jgi:hypothetical protein
MRTFIMVVLMACAPLGCNSEDRNGAREALRVWRAPESSLEQRAKAAEKLVRKGATSEEILAALGPAGRPTHYHGPSFSALTGGTNVPHALPDHDYWTVNYAFPGGGVSLHLDQSNRLDWVGPYRTLKTVPLTNAP